MKAFLISIHAKWCAKMMNGDKTIEVRKGTALYKAIQKEIDKNGYADIYVYCTKGKPSVNVWTANIPEKVSKAILSINEKQSDNELDYFMNVEFPQKYPQYVGDKVSFSPTNINGKVIFKFRCYKVEEISYNYRSDFTSVYTDTLDTEDLEKQACLTRQEFAKYFNGNVGCAIHISNLEIFDKPKELSEFYHYVKYNKGLPVLCGRIYEYVNLTKAPQSWCYIEVE